jgi:hypothetical protein
MQLSAEMFHQIILGLHSDEATSKRHEKRREGRVGVRCKVEVIPILFDDRGPAPIQVRVRDMSASGIGFLSDCPMEIGVDVICRMPRQDGTKTDLPMKVRHCLQVGRQLYSIGASFDPKPFLTAAAGGTEKKKPKKPDPIPKPAEASAI